MKSASHCTTMTAEKNTPLQVETSGRNSRRAACSESQAAIVLAALFFAPGPREGRRHVDVSENSLYWYFVVWSWLPIYAVIYIMPRLTS